MVSLSSDPARFSLALGGKDGHPLPVTVDVFDETIRLLKRAVERAKLGSTEELAAIQRLDAQARLLESKASGPAFEDYIAAERAKSNRLGGRTVTTATTVSPCRPASAPCTRPTNGRRVSR
jgi:uncharacterized protein